MLLKCLVCDFVSVPVLLNRLWYEQFTGLELLENSNCATRPYYY